jgi:hypothetical protein
MLIVAHVSYQNLNQYSNILNIANHLPPISISTFVNALKKGFALAVFFNFQTREMEISFASEIIESTAFLDLSNKLIRRKTEIEILEANSYTLNIDYDRNVFTFNNYENLGEYATYNDFPTPKEPNKIAIDKSTNTVYIFRKNPDENSFKWFFYSDNIFPVVIGTGKEKITAEFSTLACHWGNSLLTAQTKVVASSPAFETGDNDFPLTMLFYRSMQENLNGNLYPMASSVNFDITGAEIGDYQTKMNGEAGLYERFLKPYYDFIETAEQVSFNFNLNIIDFLEILKLFLPQKGNKVRKIRANGANMLPKKATFILSEVGVEQTDISFLKAIE